MARGTARSGGRKREGARLCRYSPTISMQYRAANTALAGSGGEEVIGYMQEANIPRPPVLRPMRPSPCMWIPAGGPECLLLAHRRSARTAVSEIAVFKRALHLLLTTDTQGAWFHTLVIRVQPDEGSRPSSARRCDQMEVRDVTMDFCLRRFLHRIEPLKPTNG